ncbi:MAG TPA: aminopeptidase, partial [Sporosarcina sp.]|nr:aminopeptidase [Sporosarcina sp.]
MLSTFEQKLDNYASLIVEVGANIQKDQTLFISASIETA